MYQRLHTLFVGSGHSPTGNKVQKCEQDDGLPAKQVGLVGYCMIFKRRIHRRIRSRSVFVKATAKSASEVEAKRTTVVSRGNPGCQGEGVKEEPGLQEKRPLHQHVAGRYKTVINSFDILYNGTRKPLPKLPPPKFSFTSSEQRLCMSSTKTVDAHDGAPKPTTGLFQDGEDPVAPSLSDQTMAQHLVDAAVTDTFRGRPSNVLCGLEDGSSHHAACVPPTVQFAAEGRSTDLLPGRPPAEPQKEGAEPVREPSAAAALQNSALFVRGPTREELSRAASGRQLPSQTPVNGSNCYSVILPSPLSASSLLSYISYRSQLMADGQHPKQIMPKICFASSRPSQQQHDRRSVAAAQPPLRAPLPPAAPGLCRWCSSVIDKPVRHPYQLASESCDAASWIQLLRKALDVRITSSYRTPESGIPLTRFWQDLYAREAQLVIYPRGSAVTSFASNASSQLKHKKEHCDTARRSEAAGVLASQAVQLSSHVHQSVFAPSCAHCFMQVHAHGSMRDYQRRTLAVQWIKKVVNKMRWKESTYYVAVHAFDSYIASLRLPPTTGHAAAQDPLAQASTAFHEHATKHQDARGSTCYCQGRGMEQHPCGHTVCFCAAAGASAARVLDWSLAAAAALCLGVSTEEEHTQAVRARKALVGSVPTTVSEINTAKLHMLCRLTRGLLITRTPEDFLYYFLANMKASRRFRSVYKRLLAPTALTTGSPPLPCCTGDSAQLTAQNVTEDEVVQGNVRNDGRAAEAHDAVTHKYYQWPQKSCVWLSTLPGVVRVVLLATSLAFEAGMYRVLPCSRLTAAFLVPVLAAGCYPELKADIYQMSALCKEIFYFDTPDEVCSAIQFCSPLLCQYAQRTLGDDCPTGPADLLVSSKCYPFPEVTVLLRHLINALRSFSFPCSSRQPATVSVPPKTPFWTELDSQYSVAESTESGRSASLASSQSSTLSELSNVGYHSLFVANAVRPV